MDSSRLLKFLFCGAISALFNISSRCLFSWYFPYWLAIVLAYIIGMATAFALFKFFVFNAGTTQKTPKEIFWFICINLSGLLQTLLVSLFLIHWVFPGIHFSFHPYEVAHIIGIGSLAISSFIGHSYLTFARPTRTGINLLKLNSSN